MPLRPRRYLAAPALALSLLAAPLGAARAQTPELALVGGSGVAGGTVAVVIQLSENPGDAAVTADLDIGFPADRIAFSLPLPPSNCPAFDGGDGQVTVSDLIAGVNNVLRGCPTAG